MIRRKHQFFLSCFVFAAIGFSSANHPTSPISNAAVDGKDRMRLAKESWDYKGWACVNAKPYAVDAGIAMMCAPPSQARNDSPHIGKFIVVYVNEIGRRAMWTQKHSQFPQGAVVIKEKLTAPNSATPELLTAMVKREKGFNPAGNDWEFFVLSGDAKVIQAQGKLDNCIACHSAKRSSDFVFRNYLPNEVLMKLKD